MGSLRQSLSTLALISLNSCTLDTLISNESQHDVLRSERSSGDFYSRALRSCVPPVMSCSLSESTISNEKYSSTTVICTVPRRACITSVEYDAGALGTDTLTRSVKTFYGSIDTEAVAAGTYSITLTGSDSRASTTTTLSLDVVDLYAPTGSCTATNGANDGSQNLTIQCTLVDETAMGDVSYTSSSFGSSDMVNSSGSTYEASFDVSGLASGEESFTIIALDNEGNATTTEVTGQIDDVVAPSVTSVSTDVSSVLRDGSESFVVYGCFSDETDGTEVGGTVTATIDSVVETLTYDTASSCFISSSILGSNFSTDGSYPITITATDSAGNAVTNSSASINITSEYTTTLYSATDTRTSEENPNTAYEGSEFLYIGASTSGRQRSYLSFDSSSFEGSEILSATLTIYALSGTCHSSSNNTNCSHDLGAEVHEILTDWDATTLTWNNAPSYDESTIIDSTTLNEAYGGGGSYTFDITSLAQTWADGTNYGLLLKADSTGESTSSSKVDMTFGASESTTPSRVDITYSP